MEKIGMKGREIDFIPDRLIEEPVVFRGLTDTEVVVLIIVGLVFWIPVSVLLLLPFGWGLFGVGIGVGMGTTGPASRAFSNFLESNKLPLVIDADGLNILSKNKGLLKKMPPQTVLTPHPKELERILGKWEDDFDKLKKAKRFSEKYDCILVIKGANTITVYKDMGYVNTTGNPGMATGGSGDVLTGIIAGLIAQGHSPLNAAIFGVYLHGKAADIAVEKCSFQALIASGILDNIGRAYLDLFQVSGPDVASDERRQ